MMTKQTLTEVRRLCAEVDRLTLKVEAEIGDRPYWWGTVNTATLRRRSMDLTRALADLRRSR